MLSQGGKKVFKDIESKFKNEKEEWSKKMKEVQE